MSINNYRTHYCLIVVLISLYIRTTTSQSLAVFNPTAYECPSVGPQCVATFDCRTLVTCLAVGATPSVVRQCVNPTPFCVQDRCSSSPDPSNALCASGPNAAFLCTSEGVFPDPYDCQRYHVCVASGAPPDPNVCATGYVYLASARACQPWRRNTCRTLGGVCENARNVGRLVAFGGQTAYYAFCSPLGPIMMRCPDELSEIFDQNQGFCRYNCQREGRFVDRSNCNGYVLCRWVNRRWAPLAVNCPDGYWFTAGQCVRQINKCVSELEN